ERRGVGPRDLLEGRSDPMAGATPFGPEIDQDETRAADLSIERRVSEPDRPGPCRSNVLRSGRGHELPQLAGADLDELRVVHAGVHADSPIKGFFAAYRETFATGANSYAGAPRSRSSRRTRAISRSLKAVGSSVRRRTASCIATDLL